MGWGEVAAELELDHAGELGRGGVGRGDRRASVFTLGAVLR